MDREIWLPEPLTTLRVFGVVQPAWEVSALRVIFSRDMGSGTCILIVDCPYTENPYSANQQKPE